MNASDIIQAAIPKASSSLIDHILWGRTPFPFKKISAKDLYRAASGYHRAANNGNELCDHCHRLATSNFMCDRCRSYLIK